MSIKKIIISFLISSGIIFSQINIRSVESFSVEDGLSQASVHSIFRDSRGLIWLGTEGGINKFDGYTITPFHTIDSRKVLTSRGTIFSIIEDHLGDIWYGSSGVLSRLHIHSEKPENLNQLLNDNSLEFGVVQCVFEDSQNNIWFGTFGQGFYKVSSDFKEIKNYRNDPDSTGDSSLDYVRHFYEDENGTIWIATYKGLVKFNPRTEFIDNVFENITGFNHTVIYKIIPFQNKLLLFTGSKGILIYDPRSEIVDDFNKNFNLQLKEYSLRDAVFDKEGNLWISAYGAGVIIWNSRKNTLQNISELLDQKIRSQLLESLSILIDRSGIVWIGTQRDGLIKLIPGKEKLNSINASESKYDTIESYFATAVSKHENGDIWFASSSGLYKINRNTKIAVRLSLSNEFTPYMMKIYNIIFMKNKAWLSLVKNLIKYDVQNDRYEKIEFDCKGNITEVFQLDEEHLIIGTSFGELFVYNTANDNTKKFSIPDSKNMQTSVLDCYLDDSKQLWIGTNNGLYIANPYIDSVVVTEIKLNLKIDYISSLTSFDNKKIWFTTYGDGLFAYDKVTSQLEHFTHQDGLPDNILYAALFDDNNKLWMSSNRGVFEFDPIKKTVRTLDPKDGIQSYEYNSKAFSKSKDGELFFGGINGFDHFYPQDIVVNQIPPKILIDKVLLYDSVVVNNISESYKEILEFDHFENSISFEFSALDFTNPEKNNYEYMLEGINKNWIKAGTKRYATFPNMNPGQYRFVVRGSNSDQVFNEEGIALSFVIHPPFWATWWFRFILISAALLVLYSIYKMRIINQDKRIREIETIRKRIADDFHDDLGHKLTRISLYSEMIRNQDEFGTNKQLYLDKISEASNSLFYETKDFIWSLDPGNDSVYDVLVYLKDFGDDFFNRSSIAFKVNEIDEKYKKYTLPMKWKREIILIFKEVMNNVLKHSQASSAEMEAEISNKNLIIRLSDNGKGFDTEKNHTNGRGLTSIRKRAKIVDGKIEIQSDEKGTTVQLSLIVPEERK